MEWQFSLLWLVVGIQAVFIALLIRRQRHDELLVAQAQRDCRLEVIAEQRRLLQLLNTHEVGDEFEEMTSESAFRALEATAASAEDAYGVRRMDFIAQTPATIAISGGVRPTEVPRRDLGNK